MHRCASPTSDSKCGKSKGLQRHGPPSHHTFVFPRTSAVMRTCSSRWLTRETLVTRACGDRVLAAANFGSSPGTRVQICASKGGQVQSPTFPLPPLHSPSQLRPRWHSRVRLPRVPGLSLPFHGNGERSPQPGGESTLPDSKRQRLRPSGQIVATHRPAQRVQKQDFVCHRWRGGSR